MILDLGEKPEMKKENVEVINSGNTSSGSQASASPSISPVMRIWYNTLLEFKDGEVKIIKSYSTPAKDSQVKKFIKPKKEKKVAKPFTEVKIEQKEEY